MDRREPIRPPVGDFPRSLRDWFVAVCNALNPVWKDWTPTFPGETMTFTGTTILIARYCIRGKVCHWSLCASGTLGGVATTSIDFTLPVAQKDYGGVATPFIGGLQTNDGGAVIAGVCVADQGAATARAYRYDGGNWNLAAGRWFQASGSYEIE